MHLCCTAIKKFSVSQKFHMASSTFMGSRQCRFFRFFHQLTLLHCWSNWDISISEIISNKSKTPMEKSSSNWSPTIQITTHKYSEQSFSYEECMISNKETSLWQPITILWISFSKRWISIKIMIENASRRTWGVKPSMKKIGFFLFPCWFECRIWST